jgi:dihydropteroate synthase
MGILNATPDSFSDGGMYEDVGAAARRAFEMEDEGADVIDVGGESTRPGASPVSAEDEIRRVAPVIREIAGSLSVPVSIDTMKARVAEAAIAAGASAINDMGGLSDPAMAPLAASSGAHLVVAHMHGSPRTLATDLMGGGALGEVRSFLRGRADLALASGVRADRLVMDPGVGFGKTHAQSMEIVMSAGSFSMGFPVLIGPSRKRFLSHAFPGMGADEATAEAAALAASSGADMVRVHDVAGVRRALER